MALSISDHCRCCIISLQEVISILSQPDCSDNHVKPSQVCEELDRFSLFIGNIGALHRPESPLSIESRLQNANDVLTHILGLLTDLNDVTAELLDIVSGKREGMVTIADEAEEEDEVISEANELREEITETITRLFRVSILIRQAAPTDIFAKALSRNRYHFSDQFDIAHVGEKYRKLATEDYAWLRQRLGRAITQRRHYLNYIHDHREKLGGITNHHDKADNSAAKFQAAIIKQPLDPKPMLDAESRPSFFTKATTVAAEQITPQLHVAGDSDPDEDARSYTTVSRSVDGDHESSANVRIPKLDTLRAIHKNEFECPFCFRIKKFKSERIWRKHVFSDLRPYVCTFPDCDAPYFGDINKWFHHEMTLHRVTYNCFLCQRVYYQEGKYLSHLRQEHGDTLDDGGAQVGAELARKPLAQIPASDCPCCSDWSIRLEERIIHTSGSAPTGILAVTPTVFKRHLAAHLEQLALFAVPIAAATDDNEDSNAAMDEARSKRTNKSQVSALTFPSLPGNFDDSSSEIERVPSIIPISQTDAQSTEIKREYAIPSLNLISNTPSLPSDSGESRDQDSSVKTPNAFERELELQSIIEANRVALGEDHADTLASMTNLALYYREHERWKYAQDILLDVIDITERKLGVAHPDTLASLKSLAACYEKQTKWREAEVALFQAMEISRKTLGQDHPLTLDSMQSLASYYSSRRRWAEAGELLQQILEVNKTRLGQEHDDTMANMSDLARALSNRGRWHEANTLYRQLISALEKVLGRNNVKTLDTLEDLALVLKRQGKLEEATALQREALAGFGRLFRPEDLNTLLRKEQLVSMLEEQEKYDEAEALQRELVTGYEHGFGPESFHATQSMQRLAQMLKRFGKLEEAELLSRKVLGLGEKEFGFDDLDTVSYMEDLAALQGDLRKSDEEEVLRREVVRRYQRALGHEELQTLSAMLRLADVLTKNERLEEAEAMYREVIRSYNEQLGPDHTDTLAATDSLAFVLEKQAKFEELEALRTEELRLHERKNGSHDPITLEIMSDLASLLESHGKLEEAEDLYKRVFDIRIWSEKEAEMIGLNRGTLRSTRALGYVQQKQKKFEAAESTYREVVAILTNMGRLSWTQEEFDVMKRLLRLLNKQGKYEEAEEIRKQMLEVEEIPFWAEREHDDR